MFYDNSSILKSVEFSDGAYLNGAYMLKNIPSIVGPDLLKILSEMGHGDEIAIVDGNYPAASRAQRLVRMDGHGVCEVLKAVLALFPLDHMKENAILMEVPKNNFVETPIWKEFDALCRDGDDAYKNYSLIEAGEFYNRTEKCYAVIATSEKALYANIILRKGIVR